MPESPRILNSFELVIILVVCGWTEACVSKQPARSQHAAFFSSREEITSVFIGLEEIYEGLRLPSIKTSVRIRGLVVSLSAFSFTSWDKVMTGIASMNKAVSRFFMLKLNYPFT